MKIYRLQDVLLLFLCVMCTGCQDSSVVIQPPSVKIKKSLDTDIYYKKQAQQKSTSNSLMEKRYGSLMTNPEVHIGDILTVMIDTNEHIINSNDVQLNKDASSLGVSSFAGPEFIWDDDETQATMNNLGNLFQKTLNTPARHQKGNGSFAQNNSIKGLTLSVQVIEKMPSGILKIHGTRELSIDDEFYVIELHGYVQPRKITPDNMVLFKDVAHSKLTMLNEGNMTRSYKPSWLGRLWNKVGDIF